MAGLIPQQFIDTLLSRVDIVDIVSERLSLRKAGANFLGQCPFHTEKTPSFSVNPAKQFYHCFGCHASGDVIHFIQTYDGLSFVEAIETLANRLGLEVPTECQHGAGMAVNHIQLYALLEAAAQFFQTQLRHHRLASKAIAYLKSRGLTGVIAKKFAIGFASPEWDGLLTKLSSQPTVTEQDLITAGLVIKKRDGDGCYDRFRDRIMFPIRDRRGRVVGFGGRIIETGEPKYLNSPETPVFNKGTELYGLYEARHENRNLTSLIVVEGYLDVISLAQFGITHVVATLGTALSEKHLEYLFKTVPEIILCFDGDKAGRNAAERAMKSCLSHMKEGRRVRFMLLPQGSDPDSLVRAEGSSGFLDRLKHAQSLSDFLFDTLSRHLDLTHIDGRAQLVNLSKPLLNLLPTGVFQQMMWDRLSELSGLAVHRIQETTKKSILTNVISKSRLPLISPAMRAVAILVHEPMLVKKLNNLEVIKNVDMVGIPLLYALGALLMRQPTLSKEGMMAQLPVEYGQLMQWDELNAMISYMPEEGLEQELLGAMQRLEERSEEQALEQILAKAKMAVLSEGEKVYLKSLLDKRHQDRID